MADTMASKVGLSSNQWMKHAAVKSEPEKGSQRNAVFGELN